MIETQQLRHLVAVVEHSNLLRASRAINISQSGLSRSISALEDRLGVPLLIRKTSGVEPTPFGMLLAKRARLIIRDIASTVDELKSMVDGESGALSIGITPSYTRHIVPEIVARLAEERPRLRISVESHATVPLLERVRRGDIDVAFGLFSAIEEGSGLTIMPIRKIASNVLARAEHPLARREQVTIDDLVDARWVLLDGPGLIAGFSEFFAEQGLASPTAAIVTNSIAMAKRSILQIDALTILQHEAVAEEIQDGRLVAINCATPVRDATLAIIHRQDALVGMHMRALIERLSRAETHAS